MNKSNYKSLFIVMFDLKGGWNLSFAGCGFLGVYHIGVASCILEKAPHLVTGATKIYGASAGALTASVLTSNASISQCCEDVINVSKEARKRNLGPLHPSFNLVKGLRLGLDRDLPSDAHKLSSGRLCVSLTRVSDGQNVLVSQFNSKEELVQALICSCFIPVYCGLIPPAFQGVRYVDGGISDNLPQSELKNTITISPFSGESDICPCDSSTSFHELRFTNTSIQMNLGNMYRLSKALFPPEPKILAEICQSGYNDALRFLEDNNLMRVECPTTDLSLTKTTPPCCCKPTLTESTREWLLRRLRLLRERHWWLDERNVNNLPHPIKKVFCKACQEKPGLYAKMTELLPVRVASYMLLPYTLPVESAYSVAQRFVEWIPEVPADVCWLWGVAADVYRQAWKGATAEPNSEPYMRNCLSLPPTLEQHMSRDRPLSLSSLDLSSHSQYWEIPTSSSTSSSGPSLRTHSLTPQQISFFVGSEEEPESPMHP
ncbi:patatin-like phospholipase domain containing 3 [Osmerus mordax]|uniref:patatin-like phospholipase domain containing 3 n=1 Tax=Osmerus mordax TaxID=8014 RepID=UPI003510A32F